jgi:hypothetical protein
MRPDVPAVAQERPLDNLTAPPLVTWTNTPQVANFKQDLLEALPIHRAQVQQIDEWLDNLNVTGKAKPPKVKGKSAMQPKLIRKQAEWRYTSLSEAFMSTYDVFRVKPVTWEDKAAAQQNQLLLNHQFNVHLDKVRFIDEYVRTAVDEGTVILRTGWCFEEETVPTRVPQVTYRANQALAPLHAHLAQLATESPSQFATDVPDELKEAHRLTQEGGVPIEAVITGYTIQNVKKTVKNHPTLEVCNARHVIIDPTCLGDIKKAGFVIHHFETSLSALRKDGKYKNLEYINVSANSPLADPDHTASTGMAGFTYTDEPRKKIVLYEYWGFWDIDGSGIVKPIVAAWVGDTLIRL